MKVAMATTDQTAVDAHFAQAAHLAIYEVTPSEWRHVETVTFTDDDRDADGDRVTPRLAALSDCALLFLKGVGGPAAARIVKARVHPVALQQDEPVTDVLERVRGMLADGPPPWLSKLLAQDDAAAPAAQHPAGTAAGR